MPDGIAACGSLLNGMMTSDADLIILGGGCAGLSLATRLAEWGAHAPKTVVLESRPEYLHDRTWCFWGDPGAAIGGLVTHQWNSFSVSTATGQIVRNYNASPYRMIPSDSFYAAAEERIARAPGMELLLGNKVTDEPVKRDGLWRLITPGGELSAKWIVDTRPVARHGSIRPHLWQSFLGYELVTEQECFDPTCVELMDFSESTPTQILFLYLLPFARNRALLEATLFDPRPVGAEELEPLLGSLLEKRLRGAGYSVVRSEHGILPMGEPPATPCGETGFVRAGLTAGGARPSTGYAFQRIQRWAADCSAAVVTGRGPVAHAADPLIPRAMDALFLRVLRSRPELAPDLFLSLFRKVDPARIARFMSDGGRFTDHAAIVMALPKSPFLRELSAIILGNLGKMGDATGDVLR